MSFSCRLVRAARTAVVAFACLVLSACGSKLNTENYGKIFKGMDEQEIVKLLGQSKPLEDVMVPSTNEARNQGLNHDRRTRRRAWQDGDRIIMVDFRDGLVVDKRASGL